MYFSRKIGKSLLILFVATELASCGKAAEEKRVANVDRSSCEKYLLDTGYDLQKSDSDIVKSYETLKKKGHSVGEIGEYKNKFCTGALKIDGGVCYLALPEDPSTDGDITDCPKNVLR